jgi:predicted nucleic acid-binding protein
MGLARNHRLSVYDAAYLELAQREGIPLATLDADLQKAAAAAGVGLLSREDA